MVRAALRLWPKKRLTETYLQDPEVLRGAREARRLRAVR